jgi:hypothetical protein
MQRSLSPLAQLVTVVPFVARSRVRNPRLWTYLFRRTVVFLLLLGASPKILRKARRGAGPTTPCGPSPVGPGGFNVTILIPPEAARVMSKGPKALHNSPRARARREVPRGLCSEEGKILILDTVARQGAKLAAARRRRRAAAAAPPRRPRRAAGGSARVSFGHGRLRR